VQHVQERTAQKVFRFWSLFRIVFQEPLDDLSLSGFFSDIPVGGVPRSRKSEVTDYCNPLHTGGHWVAHLKEDDLHERIRPELNTIRARFLGSNIFSPRGTAATYA
jgi:hypothetical protein